MVIVSPEAVWETKVQNGVYIVTVCVGDASYSQDIQNVQVEGIPVIDAEPLSNDECWIEHDVIVDVMDGRLTLTFEGSDAMARLCWVKISQLVGE